VLPTEWGEVSEQVVRHVLDFAQGGKRMLQIAGVPQDDSGDEQVEAREAVLLVLVSAVTDFAETVDEDCA